MRAACISRALGNAVHELFQHFAKLLATERSEVAHDSLVRLAAAHRRKHPRRRDRRRARPIALPHKRSRWFSAPRETRKRNGFSLRTPMPRAKRDGQEWSPAVCAPCRSIASFAPVPRRNLPTTTLPGGSLITRRRNIRPRKGTASIPKPRCRFAQRICAAD